MAVELIVGIGVGTSGTAVAYRQPKTGGTESHPKSPQWGSDESIEKLPARLAYSRTGDWATQPPLYAGLNIPADTEDLTVKEWFKIDFRNKRSPQAAADKLYGDYLEFLHGKLAERFVGDGILATAWADAHISFIFSVPACWDTSLVNRFKNLVSGAGFEKARGEHLGRGAHTVAVSMTEPQATAAFELCSPSPVASFRRGHNIMIIDAGAGTGDFSLFRVSDSGQDTLRLAELQPVSGRKIGSAYIDGGFEERMGNLLKPRAHLLSREPSHVAWEMCRDKGFLSAKHAFSADPQAARIPVPHLKDPQGIHDDFIQDGDLVNIGRELRPLFDKQIEKMTNHIAALADRFNGSLERLGSSLYVKSKIVKFCSESATLKSARVVISRRPQRAVCLGLVYDAGNNQAVFSKIACRASFGIISRIPSAAPAKPKWRIMWKPGPKVGDGVSLDECVEWIVQKGKEIENGREVETAHSVFIDPNQPRVCHVELVTSLRDDPSTSKDYISTHQVMRVDLSKLKMKRKRNIFFLRKEFSQVEFSIRATIGLAEAHFQCVNAEGEEISEPVTVKTPCDRPIMGLDEVEEG